MDYDDNQITSLQESFQNFNDINIKNDENSKYERKFENFRKKLNKIIECDNSLLNIDFYLIKNTIMEENIIFIKI